MKTTSLERLILILIACICAFTACPSFAADDTPQGFLERVYTAYQISDNGNGIDSAAKAARYFTPPLAHLIDQDRAQAAKKGEVGKLDFDPFVGGQDWAKTAITLKVVPGSAPDRASGSATFTPAGATKPTTVRLDLAKTAAGWRIADIRWEDEAKSLVQILKAKG
jgi:Protein of unknown function (DUF3828)